MCAVVVLEEAGGRLGAVLYSHGIVANGRVQFCDPA